MKTSWKMYLPSSRPCVQRVLLLLSFLVCWLALDSSAQTLQIDSVSVDSVWNSDSSRYDSKGILQNSQSRDCKLNFIPVGTGTVQCFVSLSIDSGKTWAVLTDGYNQMFNCGTKSSIIVRIPGGDKSGVAFKITGRQYKPAIKGNPELIYYLDSLSGNPVPGTSVAVPVKIQLTDSNSKGYAAVTKAYWDALGDGKWDDSTVVLNWIWNTTVPLGEPNQRRAIIAKIRDANGLWSTPETLTVQFGMDDNPEVFIPAGCTALFYTGGNPVDSLKFEKTYMINVGDFYPHMRFTNEASHSGKYSITTDSNRTALIYKLDGNNRIDSGIAGVQFYIMAKAKGEINFTVELGENAGSSGGLSKRFGIGFDVNDSIKATTYDCYVGQTDKMVSPIVLGHWYKCNVEVDFTNNKTSYFIDDQKIDIQAPFPTLEMYGIDRLLLFRGLFSGQDGQFTCSEGPKQYYIDDIILYRK